MKKVILFCLAFFAFCQIANSNNFEIIPLVINFQGVESRNDTIVAYGDFGSLLISYDNAVNWKQIRVFDRGTILKLFWNDTNMIAFNDAGEIAISNDKSINWNNVANVNDSVFAVIKYPGGYFLRSRNKLFTITNDFQPNNEFPLYSKVLNYISTVDVPNYMRSLAFFKNKLIVEIDSSNFIRFDNNLKPIDTLSFNKLGLFDSSYQYISGYWLDTDSSYLYIKVVATQITDPSNSGVLVCNIYRTENFMTVKKFYNLYATFSIYNIIDDKFYPLNKNEKYLKDSTKVTESTYFFLNINNFTVANNKLIVIGKNKVIEMIDLKDSTLKVISEFSRYSPYLVPEKISDSSYLFYSGDYYEYYHYIYRTDNNGLTFKPVVDNKKDTSFNYILFKSRFKYYNENEKKIYFGGLVNENGPGYVLVSDNYCKSFVYKKINGFYFNSFINLPFYLNAMATPNIQRNDVYFITTDGNYIVNDTVVSSIFTFNKDFDIISRFDVRNIAIDYISSKDTNTFLIHCADGIDSTSEIRYTSNKGATWEIITKYHITDILNYYKEIEINNTKYLALIHQTEKSFKLDVVNLENEQFTKIYEWFEDTTKPRWNWYGVGIDFDNKLVYITFQDTLFYTSDIFERSKWKYQIVPNNGRIVCRPLKKFGNQFFARYTDDNIPWGNGIFWIKPLDTLTKVDEIITKEYNYFYVYPPYPLPATKEVRFLIYWDWSNDIDKDKIAVYNIFGEKVCGKEKIKIDKLTPYSGYLIWDCSSAETGIYFIQIKHRTSNLTLKVLVNR